MKWYRVKWYCQEHTLEVILLVIIALWIVTLSIATWKVTNKEQFYKDEITILSDYIDEQETDLFNMSMVMDSTYGKMDVIQAEIISLAGEMHKIRMGKR